MTQPVPMPTGERAGMYRLLSCFLSAPADRERLALAASLAAVGDDAFGRALAEFSARGADADQFGAAQAFDYLFIGMGGGVLSPYASHYIAGSLQDRPLIELRTEMRRLGLRRSATVSDPEDHAASVLEIMAGLVDGSVACDATASRAFFAQYVANWLPRFFADLAAQCDAPLYAALGRLGAAFIEEEQGRFGVTPLACPPVPREKIERSPRSSSRGDAGRRRADRA